VRRGRRIRRPAAEAAPDDPFGNDGLTRLKIFPVTTDNILTTCRAALAPTPSRMTPGRPGRPRRGGPGESTRSPPDPHAGRVAAGAGWSGGREVCPAALCAGGARRRGPREHAVPE